MGEVAPPSRLQGFLSTALLLSLLAFSAPLAFAFAVISYLFRSNAASSSGDQQVTILLNGAKVGSDHSFILFYSDTEFLARCTNALAWCGLWAKRVAVLS